jgi:hypothetical protein
MRVWHCGDELVLQEPSDVCARVGPDQAWIGGESDDLDGAFQRLFHFAATHILAHEDRFVLHGAGVAREGLAYVGLGPTGSGKSTVGLAALSAGWQLLGDDMVAVRMGRGGLQVAGIARRPAVPGDLHPSTDGAGPLDGDHRGRWGLPPTSLTGGWFPLVAVALVGHGDTPYGGLKAVSGEEALFHVLGSFSSATDPVQLSRFFPVAGALCRLPVRALSHGTDPSTRLEVARDLLETLEREVRT